MTLRQGVSSDASLPPYGTVDPQSRRRRAWIWWLVAVPFVILVTIPVWNLISAIAIEGREEAALDDVVAELQVPSDWQEISQRRTTALLGFCMPSPQPCPTEQRRYQLPDGPVSVMEFIALLPDAEWDVENASCTIPDNVTGGGLCYGTAEVNGFEVYLSFGADLDAQREPVDVTATLAIEPILVVTPTDPDKLVPDTTSRGVR